MNTGLVSPLRMSDPMFNRGHQVTMQKDAGEAAGFQDEEYVQAGADIVEDRKRIFDQSEMIVKVKEPLPEEYDSVS